MPQYPIQSNDSWIAPPPGWTEINVDARYFKDSKEGMAVAVAKDAERITRGASARRIIAQDVENAEFQAMKIGALLAHQCNFRGVMLEEDNQTVVKCLQQ